MKVFIIAILSTVFFSSPIVFNWKKGGNILFVGNSLTYYNDMPHLLQQMLDANNYKYKITQSTYAGISLSQHISRQICKRGENQVSLCPLGINDTSATDKLLYSKTWDYVVLQEGTVRLEIPETKILLVIPAIQTIQKRHKEHVSEFVLFKTWPNLDTFPKQHCYPKEIIDKSLKKVNCCSPILHSWEEEIDLLNTAYDTVSIATGIPTVPITNCFSDMFENHPNINLYEDKFHPSIFGAYLNACVFFKYFTKEKARTIKYSAGLDEKTVEIIQNVVDKNYPNP